jgi:3-oxoacyl-[acyl-carrier protein] reductase
VSVAFVTGASRGIGLATALGLARRNVSLALFGRTSPEAERALAAVRDAGAPSAHWFDVDLVDAAAVERASSLALDVYPSPASLLNVAGIAPRTSVTDTSAASWDETMAVNLRAPFLLSRAVLPAMRSAGRGRIIHVGSISSTLGTKNLSAYCASKWALIGFMKSLAEELHDTGVITLAVLPGSTSTRMLEGSRFPARMSAEDVANTLIHYTLDSPSAHNGAVIEMFGV